MFKSKKIKEIEKLWEQVLMLYTAVQITELKDKRQAEKAFVSVSMKTIGLYPKKKINKTILRAMIFLKRIAADKAMYDSVKVIDYITGGHNASRKFKGELRDRIIAHFWQYASNYCTIIINAEKTNPMVPGTSFRK